MFSVCGSFQSDDDELPGGVGVEHEYDFVDVTSGRRQVAELDGAALHGSNVWGDEHLEHVRARSKPAGGSSPSALHNFLGGRGLNFADSCCGPTLPAHGAGLQLVERARSMAAETAREQPDVSDRDWKGPRGADALPQLLARSEPEMMASMLCGLAVDARQLLGAEPILTEAPVPAKIFGDLHGQFRDLLLLLHNFGFPSCEGPSYIFNGDWVDRGRHQLEVVALVFALKLAFPEKVHLIRGNHEDAMQTQAMGVCGFAHECRTRLGEASGSRVFGAFGETFDYLPLACLLEGRVLVVHGGIGDGDWDLEELEDVEKPLDHDALAADHVLYNMLWSDPVPEDISDSFGVHDSPRDDHEHLVKTFGADVTQAFCERNDLDMVVRSHQAQIRGCGYEVMHDGHLVRVFSARDYEGQENDGSILSISRKERHDGKGLTVRPQVLHSLTKRGHGNARQKV